MVIFKYELKQRKQAIICWSVVLAVLAFAMIPTYMGFLDGSSLDGDLLSALGENKFFEAVGMSMEFLKLPIGMFSFLTAWVFSLALSINAMYTGLSIHTKEYKQKTADFLMTKPHGRGELFRAKLFAVLVENFLLTGVYLLCAFLAVSGKTGGSFDYKIFFLVGFSIFFLQMLYMSIGIFWGAAAPRTRTPMQVSAGLVFLTVLIGAFSNVMRFDLLIFLAPPQYFSGSSIVLSGGYDMKYLIWLVFVTVVLISSAYIIYLKKDVRIVS